MLEDFVNIFDANREKLLNKFKEKHPDNYLEVVTTVVQMLHDGVEDYEEKPDPERIHEINDGDYQGTLLYIIGADGYQPSTYWCVKVGYGSCSGCDTLEGIREYSDEPPTKEQAKQYFNLALHVVQGLKLI